MIYPFICSFSTPDRRSYCDLKLITNVRVLTGVVGTR